MKRLRSFARALFTMTVMVLLVLVFGGIAFLVGLIHPSRRLMNILSRRWGQILLSCAGVRLRIHGWEKVADSRPAFFLGNHQSALDIPIVLAVLHGDVRFMAKASLFRIPLFGWVIRRYSFVPIHRGNVRRTLGALTVMLAAMKRRPISMTAFPEGTRSRDGRLLPFHRGTMKIVQQAGLPVVPFAIDGSIRVHHPERLLSVTPGEVMLTFAEPIPADAVVSMDQGELGRRVAGAVAAALGQPVPGKEETAEGIDRHPERSEGSHDGVLMNSSLRSE